MIVIMSVKQWKKNAEKLAGKKNFALLDATDKEAADSEIFGKYQRCSRIEGLRIPKNAMKVAKELDLYKDDVSDDIIDTAMSDMQSLYLEEVDDAFKKGWEKAPAPMDAYHTILGAQQTDPYANIYVVFRNKDYKYFNVFIKRCFERVLGYDPEADKFSGIIFTFNEYKSDEEVKKLINSTKKPVKDHQLANIEKTMNKLRDKFCDFDYDKFRVKHEEDKRKKSQEKLKKRQKEREKERERKKKEKLDLD